jgi:AcrR family transcriptional regulator
MPAKTDGAARQIIETALAIATESGWEQVRFHAIADRTGLSLAAVAARFRDVDAIANAWFAQARLHLLELPYEKLEGAPADQRIAVAFERWLDLLALHRRAALDALRTKLWPAHPHHWVPLVFDLSRFVHDLLDVARVPGEGPLRAAQEIGLTAIVLKTLADWARDADPEMHSTKRRLRRRLRTGGRLLAGLHRASRARRRRPARP